MRRDKHCTCQVCKKKFEYGDEQSPIEKRGLGPSGKVVFTHKNGFIGRAKDKETVLSLIQ